MHGRFVNISKIGIDVFEYNYKGNYCNEKIYIHNKIFRLNCFSIYDTARFQVGKL